MVFLARNFSNILVRNLEKIGIFNCGYWDDLRDSNVVS